MVVGIQRVLEGTDWPHCSTVYCLGLPGSLTAIMQLLGRATRKKDSDYPMPRRELATIRFLVPVGDRSVFERLGTEHSRHALLTCAFLADAEFGLEWVLKRAVKAAVGEDGAAGKMTHGTPEKRAEALLAVTAAIEQLKVEQQQPTVEAVADRVRSSSPSLDPKILNEIVVEALVSGGKAEQVKERIGQLVKDRLRVRPEIRSALRQAFDSLIDEFRVETLVDGRAVERIRTQAHALTGKTMIEWSNRLKSVRFEVPGLDQVLMLMREYRDRTGKVPTQSSGPIEGLPNWTWIGLDRSLRAGRVRGLGRSSLARLGEEHFGYRNVGNLPPLTIESILDKMKDFHRQCGRYPGWKDGPIDGMPGETWKRVNSSGQMGHRGLPKGSTLARLRKKHLGDTNRSDLPPLSENFIVECMKFYLSRHGKLPSEDSGPVEGMTGETWQRWDFALRDGYRSLPGGSSLSKMKEKHFPQTQLTEAIIIQNMRSYIKIHGRLPSAHSGHVEGFPGMTWGSWNMALIRGARGLPGGSSLAKLKEKYFINNAESSDLHPS